ncbi:MAG: DUF4265 domain-containing protein [Armatimonadetes bacterium]|nr:DUF4265 domain-containing protein [Armatimonadota bacterium]
MGRFEAVKKLFGFGHHITIPPAVDPRLSEIDDCEPDAKVRFPLTSDDPHSAERVWATTMGDHQYRIENYPFYVYGVSWKDLVYAVPDEPGDIPTFRRIIAKSGSKTVRIIIEDLEGNPTEHPVLKGLNDRGCWFECAFGSLFTICLPPEVDLWAIREFLLESGAQFEHADPTYNELFPNSN